MDKNILINECEKVIRSELTLEKLIENISPNLYIPIDFKDVYVNRVVNKMYREDIDSLNDGILATHHDYEVFKTLQLVGAYFNVVFTQIDDEAYNILQSSGLVEWLSNNTKGDYNRFEAYMDRCSGIESFTVYNKISETIGALPTQERLDEFVAAINNMDKDVLQKMMDIGQFNDPVTKQFVDAIKINSLEEALKNPKNE